MSRMRLAESDATLDGKKATETTVDNHLRRHTGGRRDKRHASFT
jgi:hypothetical protein